LAGEAKVKLLTWLCLIAVYGILAGCSEVEPPTGTKLVFGFSTGSRPEREKIRKLSLYLINRAAAVLEVDRARVERVTQDSLVLLLPGRDVSEAQARKLIAPSIVQLYHLANVRTTKHPNRPWSVRVPTSPGKPYVFSGPNAVRIDSQIEPKALLCEVVGAPKTKPLLTGEQIEPNARALSSRNKWVILLRFTKEGAKVFSEFSKNNRGEYVGVFMNGRLVSAALMQGPVSGNEVFLTGFETQSEASLVAAELNSGRLPVEVALKSVSRY